MNPILISIYQLLGNSMRERNTTHMHKYKSIIEENISKFMNKLWKVTNSFVNVSTVRDFNMYKRNIEI